jgi:hypothetical protein
VGEDAAGSGVVGGDGGSGVGGIGAGASSGVVAVTVATGVVAVTAGTLGTLGTLGGVTGIVVTGVDSVIVGSPGAAEGPVASHAAVKKPARARHPKAPAVRFTRPPPPQRNIRVFLR